MTGEIDISETRLWQEHPEALARLLIDHTTRKNIFWATDSYADRGEGYQWADPITPEHITGESGMVIRPRAVKTAEEHAMRVKDKAEVFTPTWVCNTQNNLIDHAWFGREGVFNTEHTLPDGRHTWTATEAPVDFTGTGHTWQDYVRARRMEITCGEAPYLASRYDVVAGGSLIPLHCRIGLLDRKLRVVGERCHSEAQWRRYALVAYRSIYGFEWQGDSLLLARETLLATYIDYYYGKFARLPHANSLNAIANVVSWNLWQMDGLHSCVPGTCPRDSGVSCQQCGHRDARRNLFAQIEDTPDCKDCMVRVWGLRRRDDRTELFYKSLCP